MSLKVDLLLGFRADLAALPLDARNAAVLAIVDVRDGRRSGQPLDALVSVGDLSDCHKLYFDPNPGIRPRYRLVYRLVRNRVVVVGIQVVAVGRRESLDAYVRAVRNLGRQ